MAGKWRPEGKGLYLLPLQNPDLVSRELVSSSDQLMSLEVNFGERTASGALG